MLPSRGEIWVVDLDPTRGHEQAGRRPCLVITTDTFSHGPAGLVWVIPITSREKRIPFHVPLEGSSTGLRVRSFVKTEDLRSVSRGRLVQRIGEASVDALSDVEDRLRILLEL